MVDDEQEKRKRDVRRVSAMYKYHAVGMDVCYKESIIKASRQKKEEAEKAYNGIQGGPRTKKNNALIGPHQQHPPRTELAEVAQTVLWSLCTTRPKGQATRYASSSTGQACPSNRSPVSTTTSSPCRCSCSNSGRLVFSSTPCHPRTRTRSHQY